MALPQFNFIRQLEESKPEVRRVVEYFRRDGRVFAAWDFQDRPEMFYRGDFGFVLVEDVQTVEVKAETRRSADTPNLAIERWSDVLRRKPGGAWATSAKWMGHLYGDGLLVLLNRVVLVNWLDSRADWKTFTARNLGYTTKGYLVVRATAQAALGRDYREMWL